MRLAVGFATEKHWGQVDKAGQPYILHPLAVAESLLPYGEDAFIAGVLHDLIEDTNTTVAEIIHHFGVTIGLAVNAVSRREGEVYVDFIARADQHPLGRLVKIADLRHNLSPARMANLPPEMAGIDRRYKRALQAMGEEV